MPRLATPPAETQPPARAVAVVAVPDCQVLDVTGPYDLFASATAGGGAEPVAAYRCVLLGLQAGTVRTECGIRLAVDATLADFDPGRFDTVIVAGGRGARCADPDAALLDWLRRATGECRRVASVCTGAFLLAAAGVLDGRRAATHWRHADELACRFPAVSVEPDPLYLRDGPVWSSAGVSAGMDLALAMIADDLGRPAALRLARHKVMHMHRPGGQAQFSAELRLQTADEPRLSGLQDWILGHLGEPLTVERLAERAAMSPRTFSRVFRRSSGQTPARFVERARIDAACRRLEGGPAAVDAIAAETGFGNAERMRRSFIRHLGLGPAAYRRRFGDRSTEGAL